MLKTFFDILGPEIRQQVSRHLDQQGFTRFNS